MALNKRWAKAMVMPAIFPVNAASMAVTVVPRFAPIVIGSTASTVVMPDATIGTNIDVVMELDWTIAVNIRPAKIAIRPLLPKILPNIISALFAVLDFIIFTIKNSVVNNNINARISINTPVAAVDNPDTSSNRCFTKCTAGFITAFMGFITFMPPHCPKIFAKIPAVRLKYPVVNSRGNKTKTVNTLKRS